MKPFWAKSIRLLHFTGKHSPKVLAVRFECDPKTINNIVSGKTYKDAGGPVRR